MPQQLDFQVGLIDGHAVAHCVQTGQTAYVPLRDVALNLADRGHIDPGVVGDDLMHYLDSMHTAGDIEIGRAPLRKRIKSGIKKAAKKTIKVAKKVVKSKLGKALLMGAAAMTGGAAAGALLAHGRGKKVVKAAKAGNAKAKKVAKLGEKLHKKKISKKDAAAQASADGLNPNDVQATAQALDTQQAADAGDPAAAAVVDTSNAIDNATVSPLGGGMGGNSDLVPDNASEQSDLPEPEFSSDDNSDLAPEPETDLGDEDGAEELQDDGSDEGDDSGEE